VDAPTQIMVTANDQYIEEYINAILPHARADQEQIEADIMDADIVEEEDDGEPQT